MTSSDVTTGPAPAMSSARPGLPGPLKLVSLAVLALLSLLPPLLISGIVDEREARQAEANADLARSWGPSPVVQTPVLVVPFRARPDRAIEYLHLAPARVSASIALDPQERHRGIYKVVVYEAAITLSGAMNVPDLQTLKAALPEGAELDLGGAFLTLELTSLRGVGAARQAEIGGVAQRWRVCSTCGQAVLSTPAALAPGQELPFAATLALRGLGGFRLVSGAPDIEARIAGGWSTPSYAGDLLPSTSTSDQAGFAARWRNVDLEEPRMWASRAIAGDKLQLTTLGVDLIEAVPVYRIIHRVSRYVALPVALALLLMLSFELLTGIRVHIVQYGLTVASLSLFFLLLLAFSELVGYDAGYALSAALVIAQSSLYAASVARRWRPAAIFAAMLTALFGVLYALLSLEAYNLLVGSLVLFGLVSGMMAVVQAFIRQSERSPPTADAKPST